MIYPSTFTSLSTGGGIELLLAESYQIPNWFAETVASGNSGHIIMSIPDDATDHLVATHGLINATTKSVLDLRTGSAYQVTTTGQLKLVIECSTSGTNNITFKIWKSTSLDSATGTTVYDFTNSTAFDSGEVHTTPILKFDVTANDYINVQTTIANGIGGVKAWLVEIPSA